MGLCRGDPFPAGMRFPSAEWAQAYREALNANSEYADAARAWEGDILLLVRAEAPAPHGEGIHLDLYHGTCRSATFVADASTVAAEFVYDGARPDWARLLQGELDPVKAILNGTFRIKGNMAKAMRFTRAAKALVETAAKIPTDA
jgi:putative sterol carrier protein